MLALVCYTDAQSLWDAHSNWQFVTEVGCGEGPLWDNALAFQVLTSWWWVWILEAHSTVMTASSEHFLGTLNICDVVRSVVSLQHFLGLPFFHVNQGHGNDVLVEYKHQVLTPEPLYLVRGCSLCERIMRSNPSSEITGVSLGPWQPAPSRTADFVDVLQYSITTYMTTTSSPFVWSEQACRSCRRAECSMCNIKE